MPRANRSKSASVTGPGHTHATTGALSPDLAFISGCSQCAEKSFGSADRDDPTHGWARVDDAEVRVANHGNEQGVDRGRVEKCDFTEIDLDGPLTELSEPRPQGGGVRRITFTADRRSAGDDNEFSNTVSQFHIPPTSGKLADRRAHSEERSFTAYIGADTRDVKTETDPVRSWPSY